MATYVGFAMSDSMFTEYCTIERSVLHEMDLKSLLKEEYVSCCNPSHVATISAIKARYGIDLHIPEKPNSVKLAHGDYLVVIAVVGLPRLTDRHEYTESEIQRATFRFGMYAITEVLNG